MVDIQLVLSKAAKFYLDRNPLTSDIMTSRVFYTADQIYIEIYFKDNTSRTVYIGNIQEFS